MTLRINHQKQSLASQASLLSKMAWKDALKEGQELVLATSSKDSKPNANIVISNGLVDDKLLVADCMMTTTFKNIQETRRVCIVAKYKKEYYKVKGKATIYSSGKYFDLAVSKTTPEYPVKHAITIDIEEVFDLDKAKKIL